MLLIFPPVAKPCEPPAGVALLSAALKERGLEAHPYDANIDGLLYLINSVKIAKDSWSRRALKNREQILSDICGTSLYQNMDRYRQRIFDLNKLLSVAVDAGRFRITLSDYTDKMLLAVNSKDLLKSAKAFDQNPFFPFFEEKIKPKISASKADYVGISLCYLNQALVAFALAGWIKHNFPKKKLVMGGGLVSSWMSRPEFNNPFKTLIDVMVKGEGEGQLLEILKEKKPDKKHFIPDYDFVKWEQYLSPGKVLPVRTAIGC
ncbi:MAG: radical SAM protein, partial [Desulfobacteraceae bacterium]|nr:radical SAM protein [Desulfobacteraceae bacterium]